MKKIFVDTNILIDLLADRKPFSKYAVAVFKKCEQKKLRLFTSSHSIATMHYLLKKYLEEKPLRAVLSELLDFLTVIPVTQDILRKGFRSRHRDFEDAVQMLCAASVEGMDCILTRNVRDYKDSEIPVMPPDEFLLSL